MLDDILGVLTLFAIPVVMAWIGLGLGVGL
jgi:hypothetical protein